MGKFTFRLPDIGEGIAEAEIVDRDVVANPNRRYPVLTAPGQHHAKLVVRDIARAGRRPTWS